MSVQARHLRIGAFLVLGFTTLVGLVILLAQSRAVFSDRVRLHVAFQNTSGLVVGAPVRLAGVDVGQVGNIQIQREPNGSRVYVDLEVDSAYLDRIRRDSVAHLSSKGLLGDKLINIGLGSASAAPVEPGDELESVPAGVLSQVVSELRGVLVESREIAETVNERLDLFFDEETSRQLSRILEAVASVSERVEDGPGLAHSVIFEAEPARDFERAGRHLATLSRRLDEVVRHVQTGEGTIGTLLYDESTADDLRSVTEAADGAARLLAKLEAEDPEQVMKDLGHTAASLRNIMAHIEAGEGSIGGLIQDPTVYWDLKRTLGEVRRNLILKALVRFTIEHDGLERVEDAQRIPTAEGSD